MDNTHIETNVIAEELSKTPAKRSLFYRIVDTIGWRNTIVLLVLLYPIAFFLTPFIINNFIIAAYKLPSSSMRNTFQEGDRIFVNQFIYYFTTPKVGDIVVFDTENTPAADKSKPYFIQRVVGLPGDKIEITPEGRLKRNGELLEKPDIFAHNRYYPSQSTHQTIFEVPKGKVFVFGDNSRNSFDSRILGGVPLEDVTGKAIFRYWPPSRIGYIRGEAPPELDSKIKYHP